MSLFKINADEARELTKKAVPKELAYRQTLEDSYSIIRGDAKRGQKSSVQRIFGDRQDFIPQLKADLEAQGFSVAFHKDNDKSTILSVSWV